MKRLFSRNYLEKQERGAAVVETAIMLIILVPLIFYVFFISDLCYHMLNAQESVISTIWDYSTAPFGVYKGYWHGRADWRGGGVDNLNRFEYADHSSARLDFQHRSDISKHGHPFAEMCWGSGGQYLGENSYVESNYRKNTPMQISCDQIDDSGLSLSTTAGMIKQSDGGRFICWSRGIVHNFLIPKTFDVFGKDSNELIEHQTESDKFKEGGKEADGWFVFRNRASILAGDWSTLSDHLDSHTDLKPNGGLFANDDVTSEALGSGRNSAFYSKANAYYVKGRTLLLAANLAKLGAMAAYTAKVANQKLAVTAAPTPLTLWMAATFSHSGDKFKVGDYTFKPTRELFGDNLYTVANKEYLTAAKNKRGMYYMASKQQLDN